MIIKTWELQESIQNAINDFNNQLFKIEDMKLRIIDEPKDIENSEYVEISEDTLKKLKNFSVKINATRISSDKLEEILEQLSELLDVMNLDEFDFSIYSREKKISNVNLSFLDHLNENVKSLFITGVDLSKIFPDRFAKFSNLNYVGLQKCNICDPTIVSQICSNATISLERNEIGTEYYENAIELIKNSKGRVKFSSNKLQIVSRNIFIG